MTKVILHILLNLFYISAIATIGCKNEDSIVDPVENITDEEWTQIQQSVENISLTADSILLTSDPVMGWNQKLTLYRSMSMIEEVTVEDGELTIKFNKGGYVAWSINQESFVPPDQNSISKKADEVSTADKLENNRVLLINQVYDDESKTYTRDIINNLDARFRSVGFNVDIKNGQSVTVDLLKSELGNYKIIYDISHGSYSKGRTWLTTGESYSSWDVLKRIETWWRNKEIRVSNVNETRNGQLITIRYLSVSDLFIENNYGSNTLPNTLIYFVACQSFKSANDELANTLISKGADLVIGWDETTCSSPYTGESILTSMLGGFTLQESISALPSEWIQNHISHSGEHPCNGEIPSNLTYLPQSASNYKIVSSTYGNVLLTNPVNGNTYNTRVINLQGYLENAVSLSYAKAEISKPPFQGISINLIPNGGAFSQQILLRNGINNIKVVCNGLESNGTPIAGSLNINVNGVLPTLSIGTELRWNTNYSDVDFHLLPPGSTIYDLWTTNDCYYNNKTPSWGGVLDVDDVDGYGPEHITLQNYQLAGDYTLFIHYYSDHGISSSTDAFASIFTFEGDWNNRGPFRMVNDGGSNLGDLWEVCTINLPSGVITPIERIYFLGDYVNKLNITPKK